MDPELKTADWWKTTSVALMAVVASVGGAWFTFGRDAVTRSQVVDIVTTQSPFTLERGRLEQKLSQLETQIITLRQEVHDIQHDEFAEHEQLVRLQEQVRLLRAGR